MTGSPRKPSDDHKAAVLTFFQKDYNWWPDVYGETFSDAFFGFEMRKRRDVVIRVLREVLGNRQSARILECGCGSGGILKELAKTGRQVVGVDINRNFLSMANASLAPAVTAIQSDVESLPFTDASFDVVCCIGVLSYLESDHRALEEISRVTRPGGAVVLGLPNLFLLNQVLDPYYYLWGGVGYLRRARRQSRRRQEFNSAMIRRYRYARLPKLFDDKRLRIVRILNVSFGPPTFWRKRLFSTSRAVRISESVLAASRKKGFAFLDRFANHWVVCLEKS